MKIFRMTALAVVATLSPATLPAEPLTLKAEGTKTKSGSAINPPSIRDNCNDAKQAAIQRAASLGFKGAVVWEHLTVDSDCKLSSTSGGNAAVFYTFTARGTFSLK